MFRQWIRKPGSHALHWLSLACLIGHVVAVQAANAPEVTIIHQFTGKMVDGRPTGNVPAGPPLYHKGRLYGGLLRETLLGGLNPQIYRLDLAEDGGLGTNLATLPLILKPSASGEATRFKPFDVMHAVTADDDAGTTYFYLAAISYYLDNTDRILRISEPTLDTLLTTGLADGQALPSTIVTDRIYTNLAFGKGEGYYTGDTTMLFSAGDQGKQGSAVLRAWDSPAEEGLATDPRFQMNYTLVRSTDAVGQNDYRPAAMALTDDGWVYVANDTYRNPGKPAFIYRVRTQGNVPDPAPGIYETVATFNDDTGYPMSEPVDNAFRYTIGSSLIDGGDGWLYGTTVRGTPSHVEYFEDMFVGYRRSGAIDFKGSVYRVRKPASDVVADGSAQIEVIHTFQGGTDGAGASGPIVIGSDGHLYGTTLFGGKDNQGTLFQVKLRDAQGNPLSQPGATLPYRKVHDFGGGSAQTPVGLSVHPDQPNKLFGALAFGGLAYEQLGFLYSVALPIPETPTVVFGLPLTATPDQGQAPLSLSLSWTAENVAGACQATSTLDGQPSEVWQGDGKQAAVADERMVLDAPGAYVFTLTCANEDGVFAESQVAVNVAAPAVEPTDPVDPVDPVEPTEPGSPVLPSDPTDPETPDNAVVPPVGSASSGGGAVGGLLTLLLALPAWRRRTHKG